jgi:hypothetical protein
MAAFILFGLRIRLLDFLKKNTMIREGRNVITEDARPIMIWSKLKTKGPKRMPPGMSSGIVWYLGKTMQC